MVDADLSRLFTATSLMQIDDNIMRCVEKQKRESYNSQRFIVICVISDACNNVHGESMKCLCMMYLLSELPKLSFFLVFQQKIPRPQLSQRVL